VNAVEKDISKCTIETANEGVEVGTSVEESAGGEVNASNAVDRFVLCLSELSFEMITHHTYMHRGPQ